MRSNSHNSRRSPLYCATDNHRIHNLAAALSVAMNICHGNQLVVLLGAGDERNNHEALETWTRIQLPSLGNMTTAQLLEELLNRLEKKLIDWECEQ